MDRNIGWLIAICILLIAIEWQGPNLTFDDANYLLYAHQILNGTFNMTESPYAYGFIYPYTVAAAVALGPNFLQIAGIPNAIEYIILILLIYGIALEAMQQKNKIIAFAVALLAASSAFIVAFSSRVVPDMLIGVIIAAVIYGDLLIRKTEKQDAYYVVGMLLGLLPFIKISAATIIIPFALYLIFYKRGWSTFYFFSGLGTMLLIYFAIIHFNLGIFASYSANQVKLSTANPTINFLTGFIFTAPFLYYTQEGVFWQVFPLGLLFDFALIACYYALLKKDTKMLWYAFILISSTLYLLFGTESFTHYVSIVVVARYFIMLAPIMALLTARFLFSLESFLRGKYSKRTALIVICGIVLIGVIVQLPMLVYFYHSHVTFVGAPIFNTTNKTIGVINANYTT